MVSSDSQLDYRKDEAGGCGNICHASLLTVAGLASYAVYNGLATDNFLTRRQEDISLSEWRGIASKLRMTTNLIFSRGKDR